MGRGTCDEMKTRGKRRIDRKNGPKVRGGTAGMREGEEREENKGKLTGLQSQSQLKKKIFNK